MIPIREIKEKAREYGVPTSTIERDYAQNWLLKYLYHPDIILKGGTGIRKVYIKNYRFSDDLDFSLAKLIKEEDLLARMDRAVNEAKEEIGINFKIKDNLTKTETGFRGKIYFNIIKNATGTPLSIKIDITNFNNEKILLPIEQKRIFHPYSDELNAKIKAYSLEEIFTEKIRALIERTRVRDLYDIGMLSDLINKDKVLQIFDEKFKYKGVILDISSLIKRKDDFANAWENSLRHQLKSLPDFELTFNKVIEIMSKIKK
jgi:predicted nucleotidyltransferase component of viral defense system